MNINVSVDPVASLTSILPSASALKMLSLSTGGLSRFDSREQRTSSTGSVGVLALPVVAEFGNGSGFPVGDENRVEAEALCAAQLLGNPAFEDARAAMLLSARRDRDELADVARPAAVSLHAFELLERPL